MGDIMADHQLKPYQYTPFQSHDSIRLLRLQYGSPTERIRCNIFEATFDKNMVPFDAVSWAWGSEEWTQEIALEDSNGEHAYSFKVPPNLERALQALRKPDTRRVLWVDAICIDQGSNLEKSHQVPLMDQIYSQARQVCVWLGGGDDKTNLAFEFIRNEILKEMNIDSICNNPECSKKLEALGDLMQRDWFSRRWVVQEIALARRASIHCGTAEMDWKEFAIAVELFVSDETKNRSANRVMLKDTSTPNYWDNVGALGATLLVNASSNLFREHQSSNNNTKREGLMNLEHLICRLASFQTSNAHDTIYSFLAIAKDTVPTAEDVKLTKSKFLSAVQTFINSGKLQARLFPVNYQAPYKDVCRDFVQFAIEQSTDRRRALDILCRPWADNTRDHKLPTWVTTLSSSPYQMNNRGHGIRLYRSNGDTFVGAPPPSERTYAAAGDRNVDDRYLRFRSGENGDSLFVTGFVLDEIAAVEDKSSGGYVTGEWLQLGGWKDPQLDPPDELWRTLVADRSPGGSNPPLYYARACREALRISDDSSAINPSSIIKDARYGNGATADFCRRMQDVVTGRRLVKTKWEKRLGLVSGKKVRGTHEEALMKEGIKAGDLVCVLYGCSVPVVLRRVRKTDDQIKVEREEELQEARRRLATLIIPYWRQWRETRQKSPDTLLPFSSDDPLTHGGRKRTRAITPNPPSKRQKSSTRGSGSRAATATRSHSGMSKAGTNVHPTSPTTKKGHNPERMDTRSSTASMADNNMVDADEHAKPRKAKLAIEEDYYYEFWGECYVHGMMNGEAFDVDFNRPKSKHGPATVNGEPGSASLEGQHESGHSDAAVGKLSGSRPKVFHQVFELR